MEAVTGDGYLLDNAQDEAGLRLRTLAEVFDQWTFHHLGSLGVAAGWRCWEVGAGGPSVPRWLAHQVRPTGRVLATDVDTRWLGDLAGTAGVEVRRHDVGTDEPPDDSFDLVHARLLLVHVPARERALHVLASALRPGGWLVLEEADPQLQPLACPDGATEDEQLANRLRDGFRALMRERGADLAFGRTLPRLMRATGLVDVHAQAFMPLASPAGDRLEEATFGQVGDQLVEHGLATRAEIARHLDNVRSGAVDVGTAPLVTCWGRRPADPPAPR